MGKWNTVLKGGKAVAKVFAPELIELGAKIGNDLVEKQKSLVKIPDLKDIHIDEALRILKEDLNLIPTPAIANPSSAYADESENEVMSTEPRFGSRVNPGTTIKVYYLTQEVIDKSRHLLENVPQEFKVPIVIGLNIYDAREDLEALGLKITEKLEQPNVVFAEKVDGQVTKLTYSNEKKVGIRLNVGDRIWVYYVNDEVVLASKAIKAQKEKERHDFIEKIGKPFAKKKPSDNEENKSEG
jgi:beta-lactam-binding protein with PASTA domain